MLKPVPNANIHIPDHTIIEKIGSGGMSSVYLGRQISLQRKVAIKVLRTLVMDNQEMAERFVHEATTIASLDHPHIISIYEAKKLPSGLTYFTMPYLNHGNFGDIICTNADHLIDLLCQICDGLAFAHDRGVIHRDLKPENILFDQFGQIKIADFGIALSRDAERRTKDEQILGSAHFMSPEQIQSRDINYLSDIYSLGCIIYEKLTGDHVYDASNDFAILLAHINKPAPELPKALAKWQPILNKCLAKKTEDRYQSAKDVKADLLSIRSNDNSQPSKPKRQPLTLPVWIKPWQLGAACGAMATIILLAVMLWPGTSTTPLKAENTSIPSEVDNTITPIEANENAANPVAEIEEKITAPDTSVQDAETSNTVLESQLVSLGGPSQVTEVTTDRAILLASQADEEVFDELSEDELSNSGSEEAIDLDDPLSIDIKSMVELDESGLPIDPPDNYVELLLAQGQALLKRYRLTIPAGDSAIDRFKSVLDVEPENMSAKEGINQIARNYFRLVLSKRKDGDLAKASSYAKAMTAFIEAEGVDQNIFNQSYDKLYQEAADAMKAAVSERRENKDALALFALATLFINNDASTELQKQYNQIPKLGKLMGTEKGHQLVFIAGATSKQDYLVTQNEVTLGQYQAFAGENVSKDRCEHLGSKGVFKRYSWAKPPFDQTAKHPVICLTANEAQAYASWLSKETGHTYRLPTTTEWLQLNQIASAGNNCAQANMAGKETDSKSKITDKPLNCEDAFMYTAAVGSYNGINNIKDINGNVTEWTLDCKNSTGCESFALAGNSWQSGQGANNSLVTKTSSDTRLSNVGFRLIREIN